MALLPSTAATQLWKSVSESTQSLLLAFRKVNAGDTFDVGPYGFNTPRFASFLSTENPGATAQGLCTIAGTVLTIVGAGIVNDAGLLTVTGE